MMEFKEIQKIWNEQKGETMYVINETALHRSVTYKKNAASRKINYEEISMSLINGIVAIFLFILALGGKHDWAFITSGLLAATVVYTQYFRWKRKKAENKFDRSMLGELDHAISNTNFTIRFYYFIIIGYLIPLSVINISKMTVEGADLEKWLITTIVLLLCILLMRRLQKRLRIYRKKHLLALKKMLMEE